MIARFLYNDGNGYEIAPSIHVSTNSGAVAIAEAMKNHVFAINTLIRVTKVLPGVGVSGGYGPFNTCQDIAQLTFRSSTGGIAVLQCPTPSEGFFDTDMETVIADNIGDLIDSVLANGYTPSGAPLTTFVGGFRRKLQLRR